MYHTVEVCTISCIINSLFNLVTTITAGETQQNQSSTVSLLASRLKIYILTYI